MARFPLSLLVHLIESQQRQLESELADIERAGGTIGKDRLARIRSIENRIEQIRAEIADKEEEKDGLMVSYAKDLKRVKELYDQRR